MPVRLCRRTLITLAASSLLALSHVDAALAAWPENPVKIIVSYAAGGSTDTLARKLADVMQRQMGESFVVQNFDGAGGTLGTAMAAKAEPDGYTFFLGQISSHGIAPALYKTLQYDPVTDFQPIIRVYSIPNVLVVPAEFPADSFEDFMVEAKGKTLRFASSGVGSSIHLSGELFKKATGLDLVHVPYRGSGEAVPALLGGNVDLMFDNAPSALPHIRSGGLKALAVTTSERSETLPDVPILAEAGGDALADFAVQAWFGIFAPMGVDEDTVAAINAAFAEALQSEDFKAFAEKQAAHIDGGSPEDLAAHVAAELETWAGVVEAAGLERK